MVVAGAEEEGKMATVETAGRAAAAAQAARTASPVVARLVVEAG